MRRFTQSEIVQARSARLSAHIRGETAVMALLAIVATMPVRAQDPATIQFSIPPQSLSSGVIEFSRQANVQVLTAGSRLDGVNTQGVIGRYTIAGGMRHLLTGTGFHYDLIGNDTISLIPPAGRKGALTAAISQPAQTAADPATARRADSRRPGHEKPQQPVIQQVVITGTLIRGTEPIGSQLITYTRQDIVQSGAATIEEFAREIPENFSGLDDITSANASSPATPIFNQGNDNCCGGSAFDLHGLGPDATLTLLNGHRLAPAGYSGSFVDVSMIPLSAVSRIEILADGASAIYGTDAVAGVVNIITRRHFSGAETSVQYGEATGGGAAHLTGSQLVGTSWNGGNVMLAYEYDRQAGLDASQRSYIPDLGGPFTILPASWRNSFILSGGQDLGEDTTVTGSALYGTNDHHSQFTIVPVPAQLFLEDTRAQSTMSSANLTLLHSMASGWTASLTGSYARMQQSFAALETFGPLGAETSFEAYNTSLSGADVLVNGTVFRSTGGEAKLALGASFENQTFSEGLAAVGFSPVPEQGQAYGRRQESAYGELLVPVIETPNALPWARKLEVSVAGRYDRYSDFGSTINPKTGVVWSPYSGLDLRASYGKSYRAPLLNEIDSPVVYETQAFPDPASPTGITDTLYINGGSRALRPERSKSFSVGFDLREGALSASTSYFHIAYQDRIGTPPIANFLTVLSDPIDAPYVTRDPSAAFVDAAFNSPGFQTDWVGLGPSGVMAVFDNRYTNLVTSTVSGVDANVSYRLATAAGTFTPAVAVERQIQNDEQPSPTSEPIQILDLYGEPLKWKVRGGVGWTRGPYGASLNLNFANGYRDEFTVPTSRIASWTTIDAHLSYQVPEAARFAAVRGLSVAITVDNLADRKPPNVAIPQTVANGEATLPYDPANASPIGRFISLQFDKRWSW